MISNGYQVKVFENSKVIKLDTTGSIEGLSEVVTSIILKHSNINQYGIEYVNYNPYKGKHGVGCISDNFLKEHETEILFHDILALNYPQFNNIDELQYIGDVIEHISLLIDIIEAPPYSIDNFKEYLVIQLELDYITGNTDRHYNNIGIIINRKLNMTKLLPIFDNGLAFPRIEGGDLLVNGVPLVMSQYDLGFAYPFGLPLKEQRDLCRQIILEDTNKSLLKIDIENAKTEIHYLLDNIKHYHPRIIEYMKLSVEEAFNRYKS